MPIVTKYIKREIIGLRSNSGLRTYNYWANKYKLTENEKIIFDENEKTYMYIPVKKFLKHSHKIVGQNITYICDECGKEVTCNGQAFSRTYIPDMPILCKDCKRKHTLKEKYGEDITNVFQATIIKEKIRKDSLEKNGTPYPNHTKEADEKRKKTNLENWGAESILASPEIREKIKNTLHEKYGEDIDNPFQAESVKEKIKQTLLENYGVDSPAKSKEIQNKMQQTCIERYGVDNSLKSKEVRDKIKKTCIERYGVDNPSKSKEIQNKIRNTCMERYGVPCVFCKPEVKNTILEKYGVENPVVLDSIQKKIKETNKKKYGVENVFAAPDIKRKIIETNLQRYGVKNPMQNDKIKEKVRKTNLKRYGFSSTAQVPWIRQKQMETMFKNGTVRTSKQQKKIFNLLVNANYTVALNYPVKGAFLDIAFLDTFHFCEYDGSGHDLGIKYHQFTSEEFKRRELRRSYMLRNAGWKEMRIISSKDKLPDDDTLLNMINLAKEYLLNTSHTWIHINLDKQCFIFTKEHISVSFDLLKTIL